MWFSEVASIEKPGRRELVAFVDGVERFLEFVVVRERKNVDFLWDGDQRLRRLAVQTFRKDVKRSARELRMAIREVPEADLASHGLIGRPMYFKLQVIERNTAKWDTVAQATETLRQAPKTGEIKKRIWAASLMRPLFKTIVEAIDVPLGSLVDATGAGGLFKEFKDILLALAHE